MLTRCYKNEDGELTESFRSVLGDLRVGNVFNPSFWLQNHLKIFSFRAIPEGDDRVMSYLSVDDGHSRQTRNLSSDHFLELNRRWLIKPKVFPLGEAVYVTFNTGWQHPGGNQLFVMKAHPQLESPTRVVYDRRQEQERHWAFFVQEDELYALYSLAPLRVLRLATERDGCWIFEEFLSGPGLSLPLTIGTPVSGQDGNYFLVGHRELDWGRKKISLGRLCRFDFGTGRVKAARTWLIHSLRSLLGANAKHTTSFSGLQRSGSLLRLGYGINEGGWGFSCQPIESL